jgi:magnesium-transporting ATPase (P-type)
LPAVEGLGACTLIASDKTGTLTLNQLTLDRLLLASGRLVIRSELADPAVRAAVRDLAFAVAVCNDAAVTCDGSIDGDTVDTALLAFAAEAGIGPAATTAVRRIGGRPYEPVHRFASTALAADDGMQLFVKGAPETVLPMCAEVPAGLPDQAHALASEGFRVLAVAAGYVPECRPERWLQPTELDLLGFVALLDPIRPEVPDAIACCREAGISVRMVTGDHPATALTIAARLGIGRGKDDVVTGPELVRLEDRPALLSARIRSAQVFARIEPTQKLGIVEALVAGGEIVAVTGDGVNDAPALQAAHIGVAMGKSGTDVARGASDLVLADDNFASIVVGVEEGRITYGNIRKIIIFLLGTGIVEILMFVGALFVGLPMPLTPVQLIWANLVTNGAQDVMLGFGRGEGDELRQPPRRPTASLVDRRAIALMVPPAAAMTVLALLLMDWALDRGGDVAAAQNLVLLLVVLFQNVYVLCMRSERRSLLREPLNSNPWLLLGVSIALGLHLVAMHWAPLGSVLGTAAIAAADWLWCLAAALFVALTAELTKAVVRRR